MSSFAQHKDVGVNSERAPLLGSASAKQHESYASTPQSVLVPSAESSSEENAMAASRRNKGLILVLISQIFACGSNFSIKTLSHIDSRIHTLQVTAVGMASVWVLCFLTMLVYRVPDPLLGPKKVRHLLLLRGSFGFLGMSGMAYVLRYLSISDATVLGFLAPCVTGIVGYLFLREPYRFNEAIAGLVSLGGVILIARPAALFGHDTDNDEDLEPAMTMASAANMTAFDAPSRTTEEQRAVAVIFALLSVLGTAGALVTIRKISTSAHALHNMAAFSGISALLSFIGLFILHIPLIVPPPSLISRFFVVLLAYAGFCFLQQILMTFGLRLERAGRASMTMYSQILIAMLLERVFYGQNPEWLSVLGSGMIIISGLWTALSKSDAPAKLASKKLSDPESLSITAHHEPVFASSAQRRVSAVAVE